MLAAGRGRSSNLPAGQCPDGLVGRHQHGQRVGLTAEAEDQPARLHDHALRQPDQPQPQRFPPRPHPLQPRHQPLHRKRCSAALRFLP